MANLGRVGCIDIGDTFGGPKFYPHAQPTVLGRAFVDAVTLYRGKGYACRFLSVVEKAREFRNTLSAGEPAELSASGIDRPYTRASIVQSLCPIWRATHIGCSPDDSIMLAYVCLV